MVSLVINKEAGEEVKMGTGMEVYKVKDLKNEESNEGGIQPFGHGETNEEGNDSHQGTGGGDGLEKKEGES
jgi:hypothetical protein